VGQVARDTSPRVNRVVQTGRPRGVEQRDYPGAVVAGGGEVVPRRHTPSDQEVGLNAVGAQRAAAKGAGKVGERSGRAEGEEESYDAGPTEDVVAGATDRVLEDIEADRALIFFE